MFDASPARNRHFYFHTTRLMDELLKVDPPSQKFTCRHFRSNMPRLLDETTFVNAMTKCAASLFHKKIEDNEDVQIPVRSKRQS